MGWYTASMSRESILIVGAGGLGANLVRAAQLAGASPIITMDIHEHKREWIGTIGAHHYINAATESVADALKQYAGLTDVDVIVDTSGSKQGIESTLPLLSGKGRFIMLGQPKPGVAVEIQNAVHLFGGEGKRIMATQGGRFEPQEEIPRYLKLHASGGLNVDDLITHRTTLDNINEAIELLRSGQAARIMIEF